MTPKEKAEDLVDEMYNSPHCGVKHFRNNHYCECSEISYFQAKQCALIAVDEVLKYQPYDVYTIEQCNNVNNYWNEVKQEIEKL